VIDPVASVAINPLIEMGTFVLVLPGEITTVANAIAPLGMVFWVRSNIRHVVDPPKLEHVTFLGPPLTTTLVTSAG
jgi:hypothetical protein